ncbi:phosphoinositide 4-kinase gamma 4 [Actinidia rufa]|uniref:1-phosphatidylinositol 4-kinase n=1 Tax=Actinidia rufa TaxID=165716 RepID=A0A7J0DNI0_9ERIC|nr:phosphoinositide 4-kinase gamma 4 [Actinidia rufa]
MVSPRGTFCIWFSGSLTSLSSPLGLLVGRNSSFTLIVKKMLVISSKELPRKGKVMLISRIKYFFVMARSLITRERLIDGCCDSLVNWDERTDGLLEGENRSEELQEGLILCKTKWGTSIFKPIDEEPMAVNNPQGLPVSQNGEGLNRGTRVGEDALREIAAYILDHPRGGPISLLNGEVGFAGVPPTVMIGTREILASKEGEEGRVVLIPIDHGYCLPENESVIEEIVRQARDSMLPGMSAGAFLDTVSQIMDFRLDTLAK